MTTILKYNLRNQITRLLRKGEYKESIEEILCEDGWEKDQIKEAMDLIDFSKLNYLYDE